MRCVPRYRLCRAPAPAPHPHIARITRSASPRKTNADARLTAAVSNPSALTRIVCAMTRWVTNNVKGDAVKALNKAPMITVVAALTLIPFTAVRADAPLPVDTVTRTVSYADLDLTTLQGNATLYRRLVSAADQVCDTSDAFGLAERARVKRCKLAAIDVAVRRVDSPMLALINGDDPSRIAVVTSPTNTATTRVAQR